MRILIFSDIHWSKNSSIIRKMGIKYSARLEALISSLNWMNQLAIDQKCDSIICAGDFFDKPSLTDEELTALKEVHWADLPSYFLVGNHESSVDGLSFNSTKALESVQHKIISEPTCLPLDSTTDLYFLPYILESNRKPLKDYIKPSDKKKIVISHNDLKDIWYGPFKSQEGFSLSEIEENCDLFINGHLHNGSFLNKAHTILNIGNMCGQNFTEDAFIYSHNCCILDTDTLQIKFFENPFSFNFYRIQIMSEKDFQAMHKLKNHAVVSIKCHESLLEKLRNELSKIPEIVENKIIIYRDIVSTTADPVLIDFNSFDYLKQFQDFMVDKLGNSELVSQELAEICK